MSFKVLMVGCCICGQIFVEYCYYMKFVYGQFVLDYIVVDLVNVLGCYVQNYVFDGIFFGGEGQLELFVFGFDFVIEIWVEGLVGFKVGCEMEFYKMYFLFDELCMVDFECVVGILVNEEIIMEFDYQLLSCVKVFFFWYGVVLMMVVLCDVLGIGSVVIFGQSCCIFVVLYLVRGVEIFCFVDEVVGFVFV